MAKLYWVESEGAGILNPNGRGSRNLERAQILAQVRAEECSWTCLTPPAPDNEVSRGKGNFRCGVTAAHGIHVRATENGLWTEEYDVPPEKFRQTKAGPRVDWTLEVILDRGTGDLADGEGTFYFTGPERTDEQWDMVLDRIADGGEVLEATVRATPFGRYEWAAAEGNYPLKWEKHYGF